MTKSNAVEAATLVYFLRPGDAAPTRPTDPVYYALCEADPGETGDMATAELAAGRLATHRVAIAFDDPAGGNATANSDEETHGPFLEACNVSHWAICRSNVRGTNDVLYYGSRTAGVLAVGVGDSVVTAPGDIDITEN